MSKQKGPYILSQSQVADLVDRPKVGEVEVQKHTRSVFEGTPRLRLLRALEQCAAAVYRHRELHGLTKEEQRAIERMGRFLDDCLAPRRSKRRAR